MSYNINGINITKPLIIISGIAGSGKSTLSIYLQDILGGKILSVDNYKQQIYDKYGFKNNYERDNLDTIAKGIFKSDLIKYARKEMDIIVEYPFNRSWQEFFNTIKQVYGYTTIIINCNTRNFDNIWKSRVERDTNFSIRPKCLTAKAYIKNELFEFANELNNKSMKQERKFYENNKYTSLDGDYIFTDTEIINLLDV